MIIICAWCKREMGEIPPLDDNRISHGICPECGRELERAESEEDETIELEDLGLTPGG